MNNRILIALALIAVILAGLGLWYAFKGDGSFGSKSYDGSLASFSFPGGYEAREFDARAVLIGREDDGQFNAVLEIVQYRQDFDARAPESYIDFIYTQALALCGTDAPGMTVSCVGSIIEDVTTKAGDSGKRIVLKATRTDESGSSSTYDYPIYAFNLTRDPEAGRSPNFRSLFVYPSFTAFVTSRGDAGILESVMETLIVKGKLGGIEEAIPSAPSGAGE